MISDARNLAARLNALKADQPVRISRYEIQELRGDLYRSGLEILLENLMGSAYPECWTIEEDPLTRDMTFTRHDC